MLQIIATHSESLSAFDYFCSLLLDAFDGVLQTGKLASSGDHLIINLAKLMQEILVVIGVSIEWSGFRKRT